MTVNLYGPGEQTPEETEQIIRDLLTKYAGSTKIESFIIKTQE